MILEEYEGKLKECPFCGSNKVSAVWFDYYYVCCGGCGATSGKHPRDLERVINGWNKRPPSQYCPSCGKSDCKFMVYKDCPNLKKGA